MTPSSTPWKTLGLRVFSTCPPSRDVDPDTYPQLVSEVARLSEEHGFEGMLVYTDNGLADPWMLASHIMESTSELAPLVALQPVYMHPFSAAKMVATLSLLHGRKIWLNLVAGGFRTDLYALDDPTPHDERYDRLVEYSSIMMRLIRGESVTMEGHYYTVRNLRLLPSVPEDRIPDLLISGSSDAGVAAARTLDALPVEYPKPPGDYVGKETEGRGRGLRIGLIAREEAEEAWEVARERFPSDRKGKLTHELAMKLSDSVWHDQLSRLASAGGAPHPYWLHPFENYKTFCPYLVGSYDDVAEQIAMYLGAGFDTFILDVPVDADDVGHTARVFERAAREAP